MLIPEAILNAPHENVTAGQIRPPAAVRSLQRISVPQRRAEIERIVAEGFKADDYEDQAAIAVRVSIDLLAELRRVEAELEADSRELNAILDAYSAGIFDDTHAANRAHDVYVKTMRAAIARREAKKGNADEPAAAKA